MNLEQERHRILEMKPGQELDEYVDQVLFGREYKDFPCGRLYYLENRGWMSSVPYSRDTAAAFNLWELNRRDNWKMDLHWSNGSYVAEIARETEEYGYVILAQVQAPTAPEAMVKCRLLAMLEVQN